MNELAAPARPATPPAPMTRQESDQLGYLLNQIQPGPRGMSSISDRLAPAGAERDALQARFDRIEAALRVPRVGDERDIHREAIKARVARLFARYPSANNLDPAVTLAAYTADLSRFPIWAIDEAILTILRHGANNPAFPPSSTELVQACEQAMKPVIAERQSLKKLLNADVYHEPSDSERARVKAEFEKLRRELNLNQDFRTVLPDARNANCDQKIVRAQIEAELESLKAKPVPKLSPEALATLGIRPKPASEEAA